MLGVERWKKVCRWAIYRVEWLTYLLAGLSPQRPGFDPVLLHVGFMVDRVALQQFFL
jgi:hypothetical protein